MKLIEAVENLKQSQIITLKFNNSIIAFRVKLYEPEQENFEYYDFLLDFIKNEEARQFLNTNVNKFPSQELIDVGGGAMKTQDEIDNNFTVSEFKDANVAAEKILKIKIIMEDLPKVEIKQIS